MIIIISAALFFSSAVIPIGCGNGSDNGGSNGAGNPDFVVRSAVTDALENEKKLDESARSLIEMAKSGQVDLNAALDDFVDQTKSLLDLIAEVSTPSTPPDENLAQAQTDMAEYLRNRVHQIEAALAADSPQALEALYDQSFADMQAQRAGVVELLLAYDPELRNVIAP